MEANHLATGDPPIPSTITGGTDNVTITTTAPEQFIQWSWNRMCTCADSPCTCWPQTTIVSSEDKKKLGLDLDQYLGLWAVEQSRFFCLLDYVAHLDLATHVTNSSVPEPKTEAEKRAVNGKNVAVIDIVGTLTKRGSSLSEAPSMTALRRQVRQAADDNDIDAIVLRIDSPGGTVAGVADLATEISAACKKKHVLAFVEDLAASAAYWLASQAHEIVANDRTAMVGSIGTFIGLYDYSGQAVNEGVKPVLIRTGKFKGATFPGAEITDDVKEHLQDLVDKTQRSFSDAVMRGRKMTKKQLDTVADGRVFLADDGVEMKLVDRIDSFDSMLRQLSRDLRKEARADATVLSAPDTGKPMEKEPKVATYDDIVALCPGADAEFIVGQLAEKVTEDQARSNWADEQNKRIAELQKIAEQNEAREGKPGVEALGNNNSTKPSSEGNPRERFFALVKEYRDKGLDRAQAVSRAVRADPELHQEMIEFVNS